MDIQKIKVGFSKKSGQKFEKSNSKNADFIGVFFFGYPKKPRNPLLFLCKVFEKKKYKRYAKKVGKWAENIFKEVMQMSNKKSKKVTWEDLYKLFKTKFPRISKNAVFFRPYDYMTIKIWFDDGRLATYDGYLNSLHFLGETWK